ARPAPEVSTDTIRGAKKNSTMPSSARKTARWLHVLAYRRIRLERFLSWCIQLRVTRRLKPDDFFTLTAGIKCLLHPFDRTQQLGNRSSGLQALPCPGHFQSRRQCCPPGGAPGRHSPPRP